MQTYASGRLPEPRRAVHLAVRFWLAGLNSAHFGRSFLLKRVIV